MDLDVCHAHIVATFTAVFPVALQIIGVLGSMSDVFTLQRGMFSLTVQAFDDVTGQHLRQLVRSMPDWVRTPVQHPQSNLVLISPYIGNDAQERWRAISQSWARARQKLKTSQDHMLDIWRDVYHWGSLVEQRAFVFQDNQGRKSDFFCLIPSDTLRNDFYYGMWIAQAIKSVMIYWYSTHGGGVVHASGVEREGQGYLFLGPSGAGKSTAARLSKRSRGIIVHDDQIAFALDSGQYRLAYPDSQIIPPLRAVFILRQSKKDRLVRLTPRTVAAGLTRGILEYAEGQDTCGPWLRQAFHNAAAIARSVPGYELHFRKSADFWDVIDAELGA